MELQIPYDGKHIKINIALPEENISILESKDPSPAEDTETIIRKAISEPVGQERFSEIIHKGDKIALMFDDFTRTTPVSEIVPPLLDELREDGVEDKDILLICGNGMHAPDYMTEKRLVQKLGKDVFSRYKVISHDAYDDEKLEFVGITKTLGTPLFINKDVAEADVKIAVGKIVPHREFGYSGGSKMIMPGVSSIWSIMHNHSNSYPRLGVLNNPIREDIDECGRLAGLDSILNVVCNSRNEVLKAFAGDPIKAHRKGVEFGEREVWGVKFTEKASIVITSPGLNEDSYFYASMGCLHVADKCLKDGGTIIIIASCSRGWSEKKYLESAWRVPKDMLKYNYKELVKLVESRAWCEPHRQFQALIYYVQNIVKTCFERDVVLAGSKGFSNKDAERINIKFHKTIDEAIAGAIKKHGQEAKAIVIPNYFTLPLMSFYRMI